MAAESPTSVLDADAIMQACRLAHSCVPVERAFNVGAVLTDRHGHILATGFSRELPGNTHAEECCLMKLEAGKSLRRGKIRLLSHGMNCVDQQFCFT